MARILLVEDERIVALALKHELGANGHEIVAMATNGTDALAALVRHQPDVVLMDVMIEGDMDGIETARRMAGSSSTPIIYLTGESDADTRRRAMHSISCIGYLNKPVNMPSLTQALQDVRALRRPAAVVA